MNNLIAHGVIQRSGLMRVKHDNWNMVGIQYTLAIVTIIDASLFPCVQLISPWLPLNFPLRCYHPHSYFLPHLHFSWSGTQNLYCNTSSYLQFLLLYFSSLCSLSKWKFVVLQFTARLLKYFLIPCLPCLSESLKWVKIKSILIWYIKSSIFNPISTTAPII